MGWVKIKKRSGSYRNVFVPTKYRKRKCRYSINWLQGLVRKICDMNVVHGFAEMRSPVTNAMRHVGFKYTVGFDLSDFFDSCTFEKFKAVVHKHEKPWMKKYYRQFFESLNGKEIAAQGLPTSPMVANLCASPMDDELVKVFCVGGAVYTRYADDLTFSTNDPDEAKRILEGVPAIVSKHGFAINPRKTEMQDSKGGMRRITGLSVGDEVRATRETRRKLRAAKHRLSLGLGGPKQLSKSKGLEEWCKTNVPTKGRRSTKRIVKAFRKSPERAIAAICERDQSCNIASSFVRD